jgi:putative transferase (TIGR04331 family)
LTSYLITTTDRSRWPNSGHLVFLGAFCLPENPESLLGQYTYEVADISFQADQKSEYFLLSQSLHRLLSRQLTRALNDLHSVQETQHYWTITTGIWLQLFTELIVSRYMALLEVSQSHQDLILISVDPESTQRAPMNFRQHHEFLKSQSWNSVVYADLWDSVKTIRPVVGSHEDTEVRTQITQTSSSNSRAVVSATYLPRFKEFLLQLSFGNFPKKLKIVPAPEIAANKEIRNEFLPVEPTLNPFENLASALVFAYLPTTWAEGFNVLKNSGKDLNFPESPKVIFTSNRHLYDDVFNSWAAEAIKRGAKLVIGQHGGFFGISKFPSYAERHELSIADKYLTWGWRSCQVTVPAFVLTTAGKRVRRRSEGSKLLIVTDHLWLQPRSAFIDLNENSGYLEHIKDTISQLPKEIQEETLIRIHHAHNETGNSQSEWWTRNLPSIKLDDWSKDFESVTNMSRLILTAHNGTTFLETISRGIPTLITWTPEWVEIRDEAKPVFVKLLEVGIFHENTQSLANHISRIWFDVDGWWQSDAVVNARSLLCAEFAKSNPKPLRFLRNTLATTYKNPSN